MATVIGTQGTFAAADHTTASDDGMTDRRPGRVGPNAILQMQAALDASCGAAETRAVFLRAGLGATLEAPPSAMVDDRVAATLHLALFEHLGAARASAVAHDAGLRTAAYIAQNRIPWIARQLLPRLPARVALHLLLKAIAQNAWTFAGSGSVAINAPGRGAQPGGATRISGVSSIDIRANPLATPGCRWHVGVFEGLITALCGPGFTVTHTACCTDAAPACRFEITRVAR